MNDEELDRLIADLRALLGEAGLDWAARQAEEGLSREAGPRWIAHALIDAAESITVDLAQMEVAAISGLRVDEIVFHPDVEGDVSDETVVDPAQKDSALNGADRPSGSHRRELLDELSGYAPIFEKLRRQVDGHR